MLANSLKSTRSILLAALFVSGGSATAATLSLLPGATGGTNTVLRDQPRTYQMQFSSALLGTMAPGSVISGISFRLNDGATSAFPASSITWSDYEITLAQAANPITSFSTTFAANMSSPVLVRDGALTLGAGFFPDSPGSPNAFSAAINFDTPYTYAGGDLVLLIAHTGNGTATEFAASTPSDPTAGYAAITAFSFNAATAGGGTSVTSTQFHFSAPAAVPEPGSSMVSLLVGAAAMGLVGRRQRRN